MTRSTTTINTIAQYRAAVRTAKRVYCHPMFGDHSCPVRIAKSEALALVGRLPSQTTCEALGIHESGIAMWANNDPATGELFIGG